MCASNVSLYAWLCLFFCSPNVLQGRGPCSETQIQLGYKVRNNHSLTSGPLGLEIDPLRRQTPLFPVLLQLGQAN